MSGNLRSKRHGDRTLTLKRVLPKLKSLVVIPRSGRKLSVFAWLRFDRSRSRLKNMMKAQDMIRRSIFRTMR